MTAEEKPDIPPPAPATAVENVPIAAVIVPSPFVILLNMISAGPAAATSAAVVSSCFLCEESMFIRLSTNSPA